VSSALAPGDAADAGASALTLLQRAAAVRDRPLDPCDACATSAGTAVLVQGALKVDVLIFVVFIINEHDKIMNMARRVVTVDQYQVALKRWLPNVHVRRTDAKAPFYALATWKAAGHMGTYALAEVPHLRHQDVRVVIDQLTQRQTKAIRHEKVLLLAPHVRAQQAATLERAGVDYLDLAGNAHLDRPGLFVHVEGRPPLKRETGAPTRPQKGWVKTVMAILIRPELADAPYRAIADQADVALGTVAGCFADLEKRRLLHQRKTGREVADRHALVALWVQAYVEVLRPRLAERRFQVRATDKPTLWARLDEVLTRREQPWALTGADAALHRTQFFRAEDTEIYAPVVAFDDRETRAALVAQPAAERGNLVLIEPPGPLAIPGRVAGALPTAPDLLAYAELRYRNTDQALEAAELLLPNIVGHGAH